MSLLIFIALVASVSCKIVTWTGKGNNNLWDNYQNWDPLGIPSVEDDAVVGENSKIIVGTSNGLHVKSLSVATGTSISVLGAAVEIKENSQFNGDSSLSFDGGAGNLTVGGKLVLADSTKLSWASGNINGNVDIAEKSSITATKNTQVASSGGVWQNAGSISLQTNGTIATLRSTILNNGEITIDLTRVEVLDIDSKSTGKIAIKRDVGIVVGNIQSVTVQGKLTTLPSSGKVIANGLVIQKDASLIIQEPSSLTVTGLASEGTVEPIGPGATLLVTDKTSISTFNFNNGRVNFKDSAEIDNFQVGGGWATIDTTVSANTLTTSPNNNLFYVLGNGVLSAQTASIAGQTSIQGSLTIAKQGTSTASRILLDGTLTIGNGGLLNIAKVSTFWGPSKSEKPGTINSQGNILFSAPNATVNGVNINGGDLWLYDSSVIMESLNSTYKLVHLNSTSSVLRGQTYGLNFGGLVGPKEGATITQIFNTRATTCTSPCPAYKSLFPIQTYYAKSS